MSQKVFCHDGRCSDSNSTETIITHLFDKKNVVDQIQHDLLMYSIR